MSRYQIEAEVRISFRVDCESEEDARAALNKLRANLAEKSGVNPDSVQVTSASAYEVDPKPRFKECGQCSHWSIHR